MDNILIVGNGGREDALRWHLSQSPDVFNVTIVPENTNFDDIKELIYKERIDLTIIGSEYPLSQGIVDYFQIKGIPVFGPTMQMAAIEWDKFTSWQLMKNLKIPQARSIPCFSESDIRDAISKFEKPVLKYRWLAEGKGVRVYSSQDEALNDLSSFLEKFQPQVLVSERLHGREISLFGIADGESILPLLPIQDYKRVNDGDEGPNTGGMGSYGSVKSTPWDLVYKITNDIISPVVRRTNYKGFIYAGMILTKEGPKVIEFNSRLGDPETQALVTILTKGSFDNLYRPIKMSLEGRLKESKIQIDQKDAASCCVVLASRGYPGKYEVGFPISGIDEAEKTKGVKVFHAGTKRLSDGSYITNGGRVLNVTSYSRKGLDVARVLAYEAVSKINIPGGFHYRTDIGLLPNLP